MPLARRLPPLGWPLLGITSIVLVWASLGWSGLVPASSMPGPGKVGAAIPDLAGDGTFRRGVVDTALGWGLTVLVGSAAAVSVGLLASSVALLRAPTQLVVDVFRAIPATALIPIAVLVFGLGTQMKVSVGVYAIFWPILINTLYGVAATEPMRLDAARSMRWHWWRRELFVVLPSALPSILTGIRVGVGVALIVVISTELLGARAGVGTVLVQYSQAQRPEVVYAGVLFLGAVGALAYSFLLRLERRLVHWAAL